MYIPVLVRMGTAAQAASNNKILKAGEFGYETDTYKLKIGRGVAWNSTPYLFDGSTAGIGDLASLLTTYKTNIVGAINELWNKLTALTTRVTTTESTLAAHDTQLTSVVSSVSQHEVRITYLEDNGAGGTTVVQTPGTSTTSVMSQDAVTKALAQQAAKPVTPFELTDAATIVVDGSQSINFNLNNPSLVTALSFVNTEAGRWYTLDIKGNTSEKALNLTAISGVSFEGIEDNVITSVTIPIGGCQVSYYHRSNTLRRVEVLAGGDGDYLPLLNPTRTFVKFGTDIDGTDYGSIDLHPDGLEISQVKPQGSSELYWMPSSGWSDPSYPLVNISAMQMLCNRLGIGKAGVMPYVAADGTIAVRLYTQGEQTDVLDFKGGKLYVNGVEFTGGGASFTPITLNQFSTHPAFTSQHELNVWLLTNAYTK